VLDSEVVLVTGFPGARARALLTLLIEREPDAQIWLVAPEQESAVLSGFLTGTGAASDRVRHIAGEPCAIDLGLARADYLELSERVERWFVMYQTLDPRVPRELALRVNLGGAREVAEFARVAKRLTSVTYASHVGVFGNHEGLVREDELFVKQSFRAPFEESLARAEALLRRKLADVPLCVLRVPQVLWSRADAGHEQAFGLYLLLGVVATTPDGVPLLLPPRARRAVHALPADFVAEAAYAVAALGTRGHAYHFAERAAPTLADVLVQAAAHFGKSIESGFDARALGRMLFKHPGLLLPSPGGRQLLEWTGSGAELETRAGDRLLERAGLVPPALLSYLPLVLAAAERLAAERRPPAARGRRPSEVLS
jgi:thioester reductase-like protein